MNRRAKFDATSFIIGREIRNRTNKQTNKQKTHKQTVTDISTPCLSVCVNNKNTSGAPFRLRCSVTPRACGARSVAPDAR